MHPFLYKKLEFGKPHPPWSEIWKEASKIEDIDAWDGKVCDGSTGIIYRTAKEYLKAVEGDFRYEELELKIPFAVGNDGKPDWNHALTTDDYWEECPECGGAGRVKACRW